MASKAPRKKKVKRGALRSAAQFGKRDEVAALLAAGVDPNEIDEVLGMPGSTALCMACFHRKVPIVKLLLAAGADPNLAPPTGSAPLVYAMTSGSKRTAEMVRMLLDAGAEPNPVAYRGQRILEYTKGKPELDEARGLLEAALAKTSTKRKHS